MVASLIFVWSLVSLVLQFFYAAGVASGVASSVAAASLLVYSGALSVVFARSLVYLWCIPGDCLFSGIFVAVVSGKYLFSSGRNDVKLLWTLLLLFPFS